MVQNWATIKAGLIRMYVYKLKYMPDLKKKKTYFAMRTSPATFEVKESPNDKATADILQGPQV
jgi:hypothetical protein